MSKFAQYLETVNAIDSLSDKAAALKSDPEVKKVMDFQKKLNTLMDKYGISDKQVVQLLGVESSPAPAAKKGRPKAAVKSKAKAGDKRRASRPMKTYVNPETGETVKTKGGNHKVLNAWRDQYGKEAVDSWLQ